tara:strand:- start:172 stop:399 length:228 start_codon:yes stop_codon:yes gene_type:complete
METELVFGLLSGPAAGVAVSVYFLNRFMTFQKDVTERLIEEIREDRKSHETIIDKLDKRLIYIETIIERIIKKES